MRKLPLKLEKRLQKRKDDNSFRELPGNLLGTDFFSNDYLGFSKSKDIQEKANCVLKNSQNLNGSTGSRLLSGNHPLFVKAESMLASFHNSESALIFNSGYDANVGFFSAIPQKNDFIIYDELSHASIRDGLKMSTARNYKFRHNDLEDLQKKLERLSKSEDSVVYVVTESVFSMDGDSPNLEALVRMSEELNFNLVVDEAHATGVFGTNGEGMLQELGLGKNVFARIHTFGKGMGCHGAAVLGSRQLTDYLINFSRSFIYTTALSPHSVASVLASYQTLEKDFTALRKLKQNIYHFRAEVKKLGLGAHFIKSESAIQSCIVSGNPEVKRISNELKEQGFIVRPILSPTVPKGKERLRFCIHSYNSSEEISEVLKVLANFVPKS